VCWPVADKHARVRVVACETAWARCCTTWLLCSVPAADVLAAAAGPNNKPAGCPLGHDHAPHAARGAAQAVFSCCCWFRLCGPVRTCVVSGLAWAPWAQHTPSWQFSSGQMREVCEIELYMAVPGAHMLTLICQHQVTSDPLSEAPAPPPSLYGCRDGCAPPADCRRRRAHLITQTADTHIHTYLHTHMTLHFTRLSCFWRSR
jgi:hypothetical protein